MFRKLTSTGNSAAFFFLRIALGVVLLAHGLQQTLGVLGGVGMSAKLDYYYNSYHIPKFIGFFGISIISIGAVMLIIGFCSRIIAFFSGIFLLTAAVLVHIQNGIFMNWTGQNSGEGFEYHILGIAIAVAIVIYGGGWLSVDRYLCDRHTTRQRH